MKRCFAICGTWLVALLLLTSQARGAQEADMWEFNVFGAQSSFDSGDPLALVKSASADFDRDATTADTNGVFRRSLDIKNDTFLGVRLGYNWTKNIGAEVVYDRNHVGADYHQTIDLDDGTRLEDVQGRVGTIFTSYQVGILYHPLGKRKTPWQPYVTVAGGYIDVDFEPSSRLRRTVAGGLAVNTFHVDFEKQDNGVMIGYGAGLKFYVADNVALRAEVRGKSYDLFDERRNDREVSVGISFFAPGTF